MDAKTKQHVHLSDSGDLKRLVNNLYPRMLCDKFGSIWPVMLEKKIIKCRIFSIFAPL